MDYPDPNVGLAQFIFEFTLCFGTTPQSIEEADRLFTSGIGEDILYRAYCIAYLKGIRYPKHTDVSNGRLQVDCVCGGDYFNCDCSVFLLPIIHDLEDYLQFHAFFKMQRPVNQLLIPLRHTPNGDEHTTIPFFVSTSLIRRNPLADASIRRVAWK